MIELTEENEELPTINLTLVRKIMHWLDEESGQGDEPAWDQTQWVAWFEPDEDLVPEDVADIPDGYCGTTCCVSGYAMLDVTDTGRGNLIAGATFLMPDGREGKVYPGPIGASEAGEDPDSDTVFFGYAAAGQARLGLTGNEAGMIFYDANTKEDIRDYFNEALERRGIAERV